MRLNPVQREDLRKLAFELIKLDFAGLIVGPLLKPEIFTRNLIALGIILAVTLLVMMLWLGKEKT